MGTYSRQPKKEEQTERRHVFAVEILREKT